MRSLIPLETRELRELSCPWCGRTPERGVAGFKVVRDGWTLGAIVLARVEPERDLCPPSALVIERLWVIPDDVRERVGSQLVERACAHVVAQRGRCLIAYGARGRPDCGHLPVAWLERVGFAEHVGGAQWRIELKRTLPVLEAITKVTSDAFRALRPGRPQPANRVKD